MQRLSIFDIFKIGVGPSSSHTLGPWNAALEFRKTIEKINCNSVRILLYGSLSKTGKGHATDKAIQLGLLGYNPKLINTESIDSILQNLKQENCFQLSSENIRFDPATDILFLNETHTEHPNTLTFQAFHDDILQKETTYFSLGGGFIQENGMELSSDVTIDLPYPIENGEDLLNYALNNNTSIQAIVKANELKFNSKEQFEIKINELYNTILDCIYRGCTTDGILPGGLKVKRRAQSMAQKLLRGANHNDAEEWLELIKNQKLDFNTINLWTSTFALAVNEENAALGRVVTSPTNGAAGVIPAVMFYHLCFNESAKTEDIETFFLVAGEIGSIFKKGATISAAVGGCQAEIGVSSAMAAGALAAVLGGSPKKVLMAAEIAMEHHLGLTCDPIGGLVQIPCIERNAMGANKAITACHLALSSSPSDAKVNLDTVVKTMWDTALDMNGKYKETSEGGLALHLPVSIINC